MISLNDTPVIRLRTTKGNTAMSADYTMKSVERLCMAALATLMTLFFSGAPLALAQGRGSGAYELNKVVDLGSTYALAVGFVPASDRFAVVEYTDSGSGTLTIRSFDSGSVVHSIPLPSSGFLRALDFQPDGRLGLLGMNVGSEGFISVVELATSREALRISLPEKQTLMAASFSPDGTRIAGISNGFWNSKLHVWDASTGAEMFNKDIRSIASVEFSPDGQSILTAGTYIGAGLFDTGSALVEIWDASTGKRLNEIKRKGGFSAASFSPDGARILTSDSDYNTLSVWNLSDGRELFKFAGGAVNASYNSDGTRILSTGRDMAHRVWDASNGSLLTALDAPKSGQSVKRTWLGSFVFSAFSEQGDLIITAGKDRTIHLWENSTIKRRRETEAFSTALASAQSGNAAAMVRVSAFYREGRGTARDTRQADERLSRAAAAGDLSARTQLASLLISGDGSRQDCQAAGRELRTVLASQPGGDAAVVMDTVLAPLGGTSGASTLSPQIQADLLEAQAIEALRQKDYPAFLQNLCALEALDHIERLLPEERNELLFHRAVGLRSAGKPVAALSALNEYLNTAGSRGPSYTEALQLLRPLQNEAK